MFNNRLAGKEEIVTDGEGAGALCDSMDQLRLKKFCQKVGFSTSRVQP